MILAVDCEYEHCNPAWAQLGGYSYCTQPGRASFVPWTPGAKQHLEHLLAQADTVVMHNQAADSLILWQHGIDIPWGKLDDTMVMAYVLGEEAIGLKPLASKYLGNAPTELVELTGKFGTQSFIDPLDVPLNKLYPYACADADNTLRLYYLFSQRLAESPQLHFVYECIEKPCFRAEVEMQRNGVLVDWPRLMALDTELGEVLRLLSQAMRSVAGRPLKLTSNQALHAYVYGTAEDGGLDYPVQTGEEGTPTLDSKVALPSLREMHDHPFLELLQFYREVYTLKVRYLGTYRKYANPSTGNLYVHPSFRQTGAKSGRHASSDPNLQNIPIRTGLGRQVRACFIAPPDYVWVGVDYSQIELYTLALITHDPLLLAACKSGEDIHTYTTKLLGIPRRSTKVITYGKIFGQSEGAGYLEVAKQFQEAGERPPTKREFHAQYQRHAALLPGLPAYHKRVRQDIENQGYVETWYGRRIWFKEARGHELRSAYSMGPQGTAADLMKLALPEVLAVCLYYGAKLILTCHDEVGIYVPKWCAEIVAKKVQYAMEHAANWPIPIRAEYKCGNNWEESH